MLPLEAPLANLPSFFNVTGSVVTNFLSQPMVDLSGIGQAAEPVFSISDAGIPWLASGDVSHDFGATAQFVLPGVFHAIPQVLASSQDVKSPLPAADTMPSVTNETVQQTGATTFVGCNSGDILFAGMVSLAIIGIGFPIAKIVMSETGAWDKMTGAMKDIRIWRGLLDKGLAAPQKLALLREVRFDSFVHPSMLAPTKELVQKVVSHPDAFVELTRTLVWNSSNLGISTARDGEGESAVFYGAWHVYRKCYKNVNDAKRAFLHDLMEPLLKDDCDMSRYTLELIPFLRECIYISETINPEGPIDNEVLSLGAKICENAKRWPVYIRLEIAAWLSDEKQFEDILKPSRSDEFKEHGISYTRLGALDRVSPKLRLDYFRKFNPLILDEEQLWSVVEYLNRGDMTGVDGANSQALGLAVELARRCTKSGTKADCIGQKAGEFIGRVLPLLLKYGAQSDAISFLEKIEQSNFVDDSTKAQARRILSQLGTHASTLENPVSPVLRPRTVPETGGTPQDKV